MLFWVSAVALLVMAQTAYSVLAHRRRRRVSPEPIGPPIFRETAATGREVSQSFNRWRGAHNCLTVEVFDDQVRLSIPSTLDMLWPLEPTTGMPASIFRHRLHAVYGKGDNVLLEFADEVGRERGVELQLRRAGGFLAALQS